MLGVLHMVLLAIRLFIYMGHVSDNIPMIKLLVTEIVWGRHSNRRRQRMQLQATAAGLPAALKRGHSFERFLDSGGAAMVGSLGVNIVTYICRPHLDKQRHANHVPGAGCTLLAAPSEPAAPQRDGDHQLRPYGALHRCVQHPTQLPRAAQPQFDLPRRRCDRLSAAPVR